MLNVKIWGEIRSVQIHLQFCLIKVFFFKSRWFQTFFMRGGGFEKKDIFLKTIFQLRHPTFDKMNWTDKQCQILNAKRWTLSKKIWAPNVWTVFFFPWTATSLNYCNGLNCHLTQMPGKSRARVRAPGDYAGRDVVLLHVLHDIILKLY